jgi:hypothetical protein
MALTLVIGNKNYSSWSFRPWIAMTAAGIPFTEELIPLYGPGSKERILAHSPAGKVPILIDGPRPACGRAIPRRGRMPVRWRPRCTAASPRCVIIAR